MPRPLFRLPLHCASICCALARLKIIRRTVVRAGEIKAVGVLVALYLLAKR